MSSHLICGCGWELPLDVGPYRNVEVLSIESYMPNAVVAFHCPRCGKPHVYYSEQELKKAPLAVRRRFDLLPKGRLS